MLNATLTSTALGIATYATPRKAARSPQKKKNKDQPRLRRVETRQGRRPLYSQHHKSFSKELAAASENATPPNRASEVTCLPANFGPGSSHQLAPTFSAPLGRLDLSRLDLAQLVEREAPQDEPLESPESGRLHERWKEKRRPGRFGDCISRGSEKPHRLATTTSCVAWKERERETHAATQRLQGELNLTAFRKWRAHAPHTTKEADKLTGKFVSTSPKDSNRCMRAFASTHAYLPDPLRLKVAQVRNGGVDGVHHKHPRLVFHNTGKSDRGEERRKPG